jgi:hypothetical protein
MRMSETNKNKNKDKSKCSSNREQATVWDRLKKCNKKATTAFSMGS